VTINKESEKKIPEFRKPSGDIRFDRNNSSDSKRSQFKSSID